MMYSYIQQYNLQSTELILELVTCIFDQPTAAADHIKGERAAQSYREGRGLASSSAVVGDAETVGGGKRRRLEIGT
jgi:hypothetical protein